MAINGPQTWLLRISILAMDIHNHIQVEKSAAHLSGYEVDTYALYPLKVQYEFKRIR